MNRDAGPTRGWLTLGAGAATIAIVDLPNGARVAGYVTSGTVRPEQSVPPGLSGLTAPAGSELSASRGGPTIHVVDGLLGATVMVHGLTLVTRDVADFSPVPVAKTTIELTSDDGFRFELSRSARRCEAAEILDFQRDVPSLARPVGAIFECAKHHRHLDRDCPRTRPPRA